MKEPLDSPFETPADPGLAIVAWWEGRRLPFNLVIAGTGLVGFVALQVRIPYPERFIYSCVVYLLVANFCYCLSWGTELLLLHYSRGRRSLARYRQVLYVIGMTGSLLLTLLVTFLVGAASAFVG
ncbi:MAG: hypothetical protein KDC54_09060 [Lewinella sp.]|nr:hypothetical protein [Lewinella sp.]